ncbi:hypothetical protein THASP1DRAFT_19720 [Thamnocephalis sphaerospora]|uniref:NFD4 C-terminal domain-containing protein n=1 Tax=Thamnocephalis sphaerospora TaxID=78915 RepID=A0A4P9XII6_9FUNG|nr:hypothetical protein THASP1DRAFT_19720 [Thamnocephalis sphaerospora]|eukprot:RKP05512.1 hypothetical protein THASP1DRAFT_19720 [Thamnocephalis sphaerospora]
MGLLLGSCAMYIANVGIVVRVLYNMPVAKPYKPSSLDAAQFRRVVSIHVAAIGTANAAVRLPVGLLSDYLVRVHRLDRCWLLLVTAGWLACAHLLASSVQNPLALVAVSAMEGIGRGSTSTLGPSIVSAFWGSRQLSRNWVLMLWGITVGTMVLNSTFGIIFDEYTNRLGGCIGSQCYGDVFVISAVACALATLVIAMRLKYPRRRITESFA